MSATDPDVTNPELEARRKRARRTALYVAGVALLVYVGFILTGVLGR